MEPTPPRFMFVVAYGRSGSTLTQGLLNNMPGTLCRGENGLYIQPLYRAYAVLEDFRRRHGQERSDREISAFYGLRATDLDDFARSIRGLVQRQLLGPVPAAEVQRLGFKEVLWHKVPERAWAGMFDFLDRAFEDPLYVLNRRDAQTTATSGFWKKQTPDEALHKIGQVRGLQDYLRESRPDRTFVNQYEAMTSQDLAVSSDQLRRLATFITGSCDDALLQELLETRNTGYGPKPFGISRTP